MGDSPKAFSQSDCRKKTRWRTSVSDFATTFADIKFEDYGSRKGF